MPKQKKNKSTTRNPAIHDGEVDKFERKSQPVVDARNRNCTASMTDDSNKDILFERLCKVFHSLGASNANEMAVYNVQQMRCDDIALYLQLDDHAFQLSIADWYQKIKKSTAAYSAPPSQAISAMPNKELRGHPVCSIAARSAPPAQTIAATFNKKLQGQPVCSTDARTAPPAQSVNATSNKKLKAQPVCSTAARTAPPAQSVNATSNKKLKAQPVCSTAPPAQSVNAMSNKKLQAQLAVPGARNKVLSTVQCLSSVAIDIEFAGEADVEKITKRPNFITNIPEQTPSKISDFQSQIARPQPGTCLSENRLEELAKECIMAISMAGNRVTLNEIDFHYEQRLRKWKVPITRKACDLPVVKEWLRLVCRLNMEIEAFMEVRAVATLYELEEFLASNAQDKKFESLWVGPITKLKLVYDYFKFPADATIPQLTMVDIFRLTRKYLDAKNLWKEKLETSDFLSFLVDEQRVQDPYYLGLKVRSLPLVVSTLKRSQRVNGETMRGASEKLKTDAVQTLCNALNALTNSYLDTSDQRKVKEVYRSLSSPMLVDELCSKILRVLEVQLLLESDSSSRHREIQRQKSTVSHFQVLLKNDLLFSKVFQLVVCLSNDEVTENLFDLLGQLSDDEEEEEEEAPSNVKQRPISINLNEVEMEILKQMQEYSARSSLSLSALAQIEEGIVEINEGISFDQLTKQSFMQFITTNRSLKQFLEMSGLSSLGQGSSGSSIYSVCKSDVQSVISQAQDRECQDEADLCYCLCNHFSMTRVEDFGMGSLESLIRGSKLLGSSENIIYEIAVATKKGTAGDTANSFANASWELSDALLILHNCPLLGDLSTFSLWPQLFAPKFGPLKSFIQDHGGHCLKITARSGMDVVIDVRALETAPGTLLRVKSDATPEEFAACARLGDGHQTAGILASIVSMLGIAAAPLELLSIHMKAALNRLQAVGDKSRDSMIQFVSTCVVQTPLIIAQGVISKVFLEPYSELVGMSVARNSILDFAKHDYFKLSHLFRLGMLLGLDEWAAGFYDRLQWKEEETNVLEEIAVEDEEIEKNDAPSLSTSESGQQASSPLCEENEGACELLDSSSGLTELEMQPSDAATADHCSEQKDLIDEIRRKEFGEGVELTGEAEELMKKHQERLGRSLKKLSNDLYSEDTHFVLELIQNADDNMYESDCPSLEFEIDSAGVKVHNNEIGFQEHNIRAICDIGKSTKEAKVGYIGRKGIGFKSVFIVSKMPEVHSNGFHICFDRDADAMGYILPQWIDDPMPQQWCTMINLPFSDPSKSQDLLGFFQDLHPSLLLFLRKLRRISIINKLDNSVKTIERIDVSRSVVKIKEDRVTHEWLLVKKTIDMGGIESKARPEMVLESTEVSLAFPLVKKSQKKLCLEQLPVCAFLPLRSYGFKFLVQADFDIPSSREGVVESAWNQRLRDEISSVFLLALPMFQQLASYSIEEAVNAFIRFIPLSSEVTSFFNPVAQQIHNKLLAADWLPAILSKDLKPPSQLCLPPDMLTEKIVTPAMLEKSLGLFYLSNKINLPESMMASLGIRPIRTRQLLELGKAVQKNLEDDRSYGKWLSGWLACIYNSIDHYKIPDKGILDELKNNLELPLSSGKRVRVRDCQVFFPIDNSVGRKENHLKVIEQDVRTIHDIVFAEESITRVQTEKILDLIGVHKMTEEHLMYDHVIPSFTSDLWKNKSEDVLVAFVIFIKKRCEQNKIKLSDVEGKVVLLTNDGLKLPNETTIHFTHVYDSKFVLSLEFSSYPWTLISNKYLKNDEQSNKKLWVSFLLKLGVKPFFAVEEKVEELTPEDLKNSCWSCLSSVLPKRPVYKFHNFESPELASLMELKECRQRQKIYKILDENWETMYQQYKHCRITDADGNVLNDSGDSSFAMVLRRPWLPIKKSNTFLSPDKAFEENNETQKLLQHHVQYVDVELKQGSFANFLRINFKVTTEKLLQLLRGWSEQQSFSASLNHLQTVYYELLQNLSGGQLPKAMDFPSIFLPDKISPFNKVVPGRFYAPSDLYLTDFKGFIEEYHETLVEHHHELGKKRVVPRDLHDRGLAVFFQSLNVMHEPSPCDLISLATHVAVLKDVRSGQSDVWQLLSQVGSMLESMLQPEQATLVQELVSTIGERPLFPSLGGAWLRIGDLPLFPDSEAMVKLFAEEPTNILAMPSDDDKQRLTPSLLCIYCHLGVPFLSSKIHNEVFPESFAICAPLQMLMRELLPAIQRFLYNRHRNIYNSYKPNNMADTMKRKLYASVTRLDTAYTLTTPSGNLVKTQLKECHIADDAMYLHASCLTPRRNSIISKKVKVIIGEVTKFFSRGDSQCESNLRLFLQDFADENFSPSFFEQNCLKLLPESHEKWIVEKPKVVEEKPTSSSYEASMEVGNNVVIERPAGPGVWPPPEKGQTLARQVEKHDENPELTWKAPPRPENKSIKLFDNEEEYEEIKEMGDGKSREQKGAGGECKSERGSIEQKSDTASQGASQVKEEESQGRAISQSQSEKSEWRKFENGGARNTGTQKRDNSLMEEDTQKNLDQKTDDVGQSGKSGSPPPTRSYVEELSCNNGKHDEQGNIFTEQTPPRVEMEEYTPSKSNLDDIPLDFGKGSDEIGRIGEWLAFAELRTRGEILGRKIVNLKWMNEDATRDLPFDLEATVQDEALNEIVLKIEVKSTSSMEKKHFDISMQELIKCQQEGDKYVLLRIYGVGGKAKIVVMQNLQNLLYQKVVRLFMLI